MCFCLILVLGIPLILAFFWLLIVLVDWWWNSRKPGGDGGIPTYWGQV